MEEVNQERAVGDSISIKLELPTLELWGRQPTHFMDAIGTAASPHGRSIRRSLSNAACESRASREFPVDKITLPSGADSGRPRTLALSRRRINARIYLPERDRVTMPAIRLVG